MKKDQCVTKSSTDLIIDPEAEQDIQDILQYTLDTWGDDQVEAYWSVIWDAFQRIRVFPEMGRRRPFPNEREVVLAHHIIVYRHHRNIVTVLRILNPRRRRR